MGLIDQLVRLANALSEEDTSRTHTGEINGVSGRINYAVTLDSVGTGHTQQREHRPRYLTDVRKAGDELVVTVDLPGVSDDDLSVTFDEETSTIVIRDAGHTIKRLGLRWSDAVVREATYNNQILELRIGGATQDG
ncbi:gas vesicle protein GvpH [Haladaptatus caseinilyticus]|uniref:gas vesicle protein GvpH n=1 Tax=Haladaptatus caseinilyticus TaxID=2993314 RepID=UPI00224ABDD5|nr:gas vesicle protein GvpH [Haladaptatus caseinilyticus]